MSIGGVTGLPLQRDYLNPQNIETQQSNQIGVFSGKQDEGKVVAQKLQEMGQIYQQKGSIFQTETLKTNVVEDGYMGKLVDQKWAQVNFEYEQTNAKRLSLSNQSLENAVIKSNINLNNYEAKIKTTNVEVSELDKKINANTKEIETMAKLFSTEDLSKAAQEYAKSNFDASSNKDNILSKDLSSLIADKNKSTANVEIANQKKIDSGNAIVSLVANKANIAQQKTSNTSKKASLVFDISSIKDQIGELKSKKGIAALPQVAVTTGNTVTEAAPNATIAIEAANNNTAVTTIAEAQNSDEVEKDNSTETSKVAVAAEKTQAEIDAEIDAQILSLEDTLAVKMNEQSQIDKEMKSLDNEEAKIDKDISAKQKEQKLLDSQIEEAGQNLPEIDNKIASKQKELDDNQKITKEKENIYKKASETHSADLEKKQAIEAKYNQLKIDTAAMNDKRENSDKGLKQLNNLKEYLTILLDGQGNAKAGAKAELEIAEKKESTQYETLQIKNNVVNESKFGLFSQKDVTIKAKGDLQTVSSQMEEYSNVFSGIKKAS